MNRGRAEGGSRRGEGAETGLKSRTGTGGNPEPGLVIACRLDRTWRWGQLDIMMYWDGAVLGPKEVRFAGKFFTSFGIGSVSMGQGEVKCKTRKEN